MLKKYLAAGLLLLLSFNAVKAQDPLREKIAQLAKTANGIVGVSVLGLESRDTLNYNGNARLVMHSVMKFPIAMTALHLVDSGVLTLNQTIHIKKSDLPETAVSPLRDKYPNGDADVTISELLSDMVSYSDNDACDILLKKIGGPQQVMSYLHSIKIRGINVATNEAGQNVPGAWEVQYTNWCKPADMIKLLDVFYTGKALSAESKAILYKIMTETSTGPHRIKGMLPTGTIVAHKTGSSGTNEAGLSPATNDVGIITLPNGRHLAIAIFVCNSTADLATREGVIAKIAKAVYDANVNK
ncbi:MAG: class beta-lactamase [Mucilaginibacter sp.]|nr:class beta-lactamase [Mucilaginibacter sp.]